MALRFEEITIDATLSVITDFAFVPGRDEWLVLGKDGQVWHLRHTGDSAIVLGSFVVPGVHSELDCGATALAFDPDWASNHFLYVATCIDSTQGSILRLRTDLEHLEAAAATTVEILRAGDILANRPWHNLGAMGFEPSGVMWALVGDKSVPSNGQSLDDVLGAVVRIVPSREPDGEGHVPAPDNPWLGDPTREPDVVAVGLRSPWRGALDSRGRLWIGDVGEDSFEEIDVMDRQGLNFGWAEHEGPCVGDDCERFTDPVVAWAHEGPSRYAQDDPDASDTELRAAWVGLEHRPPEDDPYDGALASRMLFGDFCVGFVRALELGDDGRVIADQPLGHLEGASAWAQGQDGWIYASSFGGCDTSESTDAQPPTGRLWRAVLSR
ncbi:MAG: PQQ-dependent sugar dehydrogenase [Deltaproteobacteria bacterium]|nr:PQQ-dependent sugar dehydrogenase [Deltaproteobacteria bacterium]